LRRLALSNAYRLLEPGPVVLVTTAQAGRFNIMTMSWHMMMEFEPPLLGCVISEGNYSFTALNETGECVIAIPPARLASKVVGVGNCHGDKVDKFKRFRLTPTPARKVKPPLIGECFANLECRVRDRAMLSRYDMFVLEVVEAWRDPKQKAPKTIHHQGYGQFAVDGRIIKLASKMK
jgi:flavin reductase (DIM6/NTAB) family NADH-FMN oxidoreductase RutF